MRAHLSLYWLGPPPGRREPVFLWMSQQTPGTSLTTAPLNQPHLLPTHGSAHAVSLIQNPHTPFTGDPASTDSLLQRGETVVPLEDSDG